MHSLTHKLTFFAKFPLIIRVAAFAYRAAVRRDADATMLARIPDFTGVAAVPPENLEQRITCLKTLYELRTCRRYNVGIFFWEEC